MKVGVAVTLTGLKQRPDLNGRHGYLVDRQHRDGYQFEDMQRWPVQLIANTSQDRPGPSAESDDRLLVREQNLIAEPAADALIESLLTDPDCLLCILGQLETAAQLGAAAAVARLWRAQCEEDSPVWTQLYARHYAPVARTGGHSGLPAQRNRTAATSTSTSASATSTAGATGAAPPLSPEDRVRLYATAKAAFRLRAGLPHAASSAAFDFGDNVCRRSDGTFISQADPRHLDSQPLIRAARQLQPLVGNIGYFEVTGLHGSSVGLVRGPAYNPASYTGHIGWKRTSYALHSDDGSKWRKDRSFSCGEQGQPYHPAGFGPNATVGVGIDFGERSLFFTLNGRFLGVAFTDVDPSRPGSATALLPTALYPVVALHEPGDSARFNMGRERFAFDLEAHALSRTNVAPTV